MDAEFLKVTLLTPSTERRVVTAQLRGMGEDGDDNGAEPFEDAEVLNPVGFITRPALTDTTEALGLRRGDEMVVAAIVDKGQNAVNIETGETRVQGCGTSNQSAEIRIRASGAITVASTGSGEITITSAGAITITSATGTNLNLTAGTNVVMNSGTRHVARESDRVDATVAMAAWITSVTAALNGILGPGTITSPASFGAVAGYPAAGSATVLVP